MIIGIGGVSNSGKSALSRQIIDAIEPKTAIIVCQDDYTIPENRIRKTGDHIDWENPQSIDFGGYIDALTKASESHSVVIAEGLMAFYPVDLNKMYDKRIFLSISKAEFIKRKKNDLRWGQEPDWYIQHIWSSFIKYGQPPDNQQNMLVVDATTPVDLPLVLRHLFG